LVVAGRGAEGGEVDDDGRYRVLAEPDPRQRADWLAGHLTDLLHTLRAADRFHLPTDDDGLPLN
ncbi:MAG: hypothetical protein AAGI54_09715, partial [Planctomycetota bacterium]